jgi:hypothetical protein
VFCSFKSKDFDLFEITFACSIIKTQNYCECNTIKCKYLYIHLPLNSWLQLCHSQNHLKVSALKQFVFIFICHLLIAILHIYCEQILCPWTPCVTHSKMPLFLFSILEFFLVNFSTNFYCCVCVYRCVAVIECWVLLF